MNGFTMCAIAAAFGVAVYVLASWARSAFLLEGATRAAKRERDRAEKLEALLAARIETQEQIKAQAYCEGWEERRAFEECLREEEWNARAEKLKGMTN